MTTIRLELRRDASGGTVGITGNVTANRTRVRRDGAVIVYPGTIDVPLAGAAAFTLDPPATDEAWILRLYPDGEQPEVRIVRFAAGVVDWADLVDVDPATLDPTVPGVIAAWEAVVAEVDAARATTLTAVAAAQATALALIAAAGSGITYTQSTPSAQWSIPHGLGRRPNVALFDATGRAMIADVAATSSLVVVTYANPTAGSAVLT